MKREDLRVLKTKKAIRASILSLLREKAFENITVKDITRRAVIGKGTFYYHYRDKYDLAEQLIREDIRSWGEHLWNYYLKREPSAAPAQPQTVLADLYLLRDIRSKGFSADRLIRESLRDLIGILVRREQGIREADITARTFAAMVYELFFEGTKCGAEEEVELFGAAVRDLHYLTGILSKTETKY